MSHYSRTGAAGANLQPAGVTQATQQVPFDPHSEEVK